MNEDTHHLNTLPHEDTEAIPANDLPKVKNKKIKTRKKRTKSKQPSEKSSQYEGISTFNEADPNVKTLKYNGSTIRMHQKDLKSRKNLIAKNAEIVYPKENMGRDIGKIQKGLPHGYGVKTWPDGKKY